MTKGLELLRQNTPITLCTNIELESLTTQMHLNLQSSNSSNLIRTYSHDWDSDNMEIAESEMRKSLIQLQIEHVLKIISGRQNLLCFYKRFSWSFVV